MTEQPDPGISVCLATYNGEDYIEEQLSSIINQLPKNSEIIISDDNSTDTTVHIINSFTDHRIKLIKNMHTAGVVGNFQNAIKTSTRQIIYLADQDDIWSPDKIEKTLPLLQSYLLICHDCTLVDNDGTLLQHSLFDTNGAKPGIIKNVVRNSYTGCCMAFRRELLEAALPFPKYIYMHDIWLGLVAEYYGKVLFIERKLIKFRRHINTNTDTGNRSANRLSMKIVMRLQLVTCLIARIISIGFKKKKGSSVFR